MQYRAQADDAQVLAADAYAGLGRGGDVDGCDAESRGVLCCEVLVSCSLYFLNK